MLLEDCGAGRDELEHLQRIVTSMPRASASMRTISSGEPVFGFVLRRSAGLDVYQVVSCERIGSAWYELREWERKT